MLPRDLPATDVLPFAHAADALGFAELWVVEDCFFRGGIAQAAAVLASTPRIHVGIGILPAAVRVHDSRRLAVRTGWRAWFTGLVRGRWLRADGRGAMFAANAIS